MKAGFAEIDITPPLGVQKLGWIKVIVADRILDPLFARAAVFKAGGQRVGFVQLDMLIVTAEQTSTIRRRIEKACGFPGRHVMVSATHNHAGPATASLGDATADEGYVGSMLDKVVAVFCQAAEHLQDAEVGFGGCFEFGVAHNRRVVMRDGTVKTHGSFRDSQALHLEGPIDPEVAVLAARGRDGRLMGTMVNFGCHPTQHGGTTEISAGYPGVLAAKLKEAGCPVTMFLNGPCGNVHTANPETGGDLTKEEAGSMLAKDVMGVVLSDAPLPLGGRKIQWRGEMKIDCRWAEVRLPYRTVTEEQIKGTVRGAQRFVDPSSYDRHMPKLLEEIRRQGSCPAEVQAISMDEFSFVGVPAEYFVEFGLRIKEASQPRHALVVELANGSEGYVPHREAFGRGGYETTFCRSSKLAPEAGDLLAERAIALLREGSDLTAAGGMQTAEPSRYPR